MNGSSLSPRATARHTPLGTCSLPLLSPASQAPSGTARDTHHRAMTPPPGRPLLQMTVNSASEGCQSLDAPAMAPAIHLRPLALSSAAGCPVWTSRGEKGISPLRVYRQNKNHPDLSLHIREHAGKDFHEGGQAGGAPEAAAHQGAHPDVFRCDVFQRTHQPQSGRSRRRLQMARRQPPICSGLRSPRGGAAPARSSGRGCRVRPVRVLVTRCSLVMGRLPAPVAQRRFSCTDSVLAVYCLLSFSAVYCMSRVSACSWRASR